MVEGEGGTDTMLFNGSNAGEDFVVSADGERVRLFRNIAAVDMDVAGVEHVVVNARGGADLVTVNDLTGSGVST